MPENPIAAPMQVQSASTAAQGSANTAMDWATQAVSLDFRKQQLQQNQDSLDQYKKQAAIKTGQWKMGNYARFGAMDKGPLKTKLLDIFQDQAQNAGSPVPDSHRAALEDPSLQPQFQALGVNIAKSLDFTGDRQKAIGEVYAHSAASQEDFSEKGLPELNGLYGALAGKEATAKASAERFGAGLDAREVNKALMNGQKDTQLAESQLTNIARGKDFIRDMGTKFKSTPQAFNQLQAEQNRILQGAKGMTEGSSERLKAESYANTLTNVIQKVAGIPVDTPMKDWVKQVGSEFDTMAESNMNDIDARHEKMRAGFEAYPAAQGALDKMYAGVRRSNSRPQRFGEWKGYNQDGALPSSAKEEADQKEKEPANPNTGTDSDIKTTANPTTEHINRAKAALALIQKNAGGDQQKLQSNMTKLKSRISPAVQKAIGIQ